MKSSVSNSSVHFTLSQNDRRKRNISRFCDPPKVASLVLLLAVQLFLCCGRVNGDELSSVNSKEWVNSVPFKSIPTRTVHELEKWAELQGQEVARENKHPVDSGDERISEKWYASHKNDPRVGFFYAAVNPSSTSTSTTPAPEVYSNPYQSLPISAPANDGTDYFLKQRKKNRRKKTMRSDAKKNESTSLDVATTPSPPSTFNVLAQKFNELMEAYNSGGRNIDDENGSESGRTFFITPLLAYLFPVFLAQMFGMGMIPAAALITLPIFLLPLGIAAAVFLI